MIWYDMAKIFEITLKDQGFRNAGRLRNSRGQVLRKGPDQFIIPAPPRITRRDIAQAGGIQAAAQAAFERGLQKLMDDLTELINEGPAHCTICWPGGGTLVFPQEFLDFCRKNGITNQIHLPGRESERESMSWEEMADHGIRKVFVDDALHQLWD